MSEQIRAPWSGEQVAGLNAWQRNGYVHPFTCGRRGESPHRWLHGDIGVLVATTEGWMCLDCDYTQDWAWDFMVSRNWDDYNPFEFLNTGR